MIALTQSSTGFVQMGHVSPRIFTTFEKGTNPTVVCDLGRLWPCRSRTQGAGLGGAKCKAEEAEMRSFLVRYSVLQGPCHKKAKLKPHRAQRVHHTRRGGR